MKKLLVLAVLCIVTVAFTSNDASAQKRKTKGKSTTAAKKRPVKKRTTKSKTTTNIQQGETTTAQAATPPPPPLNDSLPIKKVLPSLRPDEAVETVDLKDRTPLPYEHLRADDAMYRQRLWREIDAREKINQTFMYKADENNGNQRFISILMTAIQDDSITVFGDDRFSIPLTKEQVAKQLSGAEIESPQFDSLGNLVGTKIVRNEVNLDSFYRFRIKEEVIFDKESSRLFWRILGIAPVKNVETSTGIRLGDQELFWVYYPDIRPFLAKYDVYNGKNYGARISWEELFENRMFSGRVIKTSMLNSNDLYLNQIPGLTENALLQLYKGKEIEENIFNYEQDLWQP